MVLRLLTRCCMESQQVLFNAIGCFGLWNAQKRVATELKKVLTKDDAAAATLAVVNDAGTFNFADGTGGFNGSLRLE